LTSNTYHKLLLCLLAFCSCQKQPCSIVPLGLGGEFLRDTLCIFWDLFSPVFSVLFLLSVLLCFS
jgi:hypothetical protein